MSAAAPGEAGSQSRSKRADRARWPGPPTLPFSLAPTSGFEVQAHRAPTRRPPSRPVEPAGGGEPGLPRWVWPLPSAVAGDSPAPPAPSSRYPAPRPRSILRSRRPPLSLLRLPPSAPWKNADPRSPWRRRASRASPSHPRPALSGFPGSQRRGIPADWDRTGSAGPGQWGRRSRGEPRAPHSPQLLRRGVGSTARGLLSCRTGARAWRQHAGNVRLGTRGSGRDQKVSGGQALWGGTWIHPPPFFAPPIARRSLVRGCEPLVFLPWCICNNTVNNRLQTIPFDPCNLVN